MNEARYQALDVAKFIISYCNEQDTPISNIQLQKILFFAWRDYFIDKQNFLFSERIQAWQYGHVVPSVYFEYSKYSSLKLKFLLQNKITEEDRVIIMRTCDKYRNRTVSELISESHREDGSWNTIYKTGLKMDIPFNVIIERDC